MTDFDIPPRAFHHEEDESVPLADAYDDTSNYGRNVLTDGETVQDEGDVDEKDADIYKEGPDPYTLTATDILQARIQALGHAGQLPAVDADALIANAKTIENYLFNG